MSELLGYQPSNSAVYYRPAKRIDWIRTIIGLTLAIAGAVAGGWAYATIQPTLHRPMERVGGVFVAAVATGLLAWIPIRFGRVRIVAVAALIGAAVGMTAIYAMWVAWVHVVYAKAGVSIPYFALIAEPFGLMRVIRLMNRTGTWSYNGDVIRGITLLIYWILEAALILAAAVMIPVFGLYSEDPTCRACRRRCVTLRNLPRFSTDREAEFVAAIESRDFAKIALHDPPAHEDAPELSLRLMVCPECGQTNVLTLSRVAWVIQGSQLRASTKPLVNQLLVTSDEVEQIVVLCAQIKRQRESVKETPELENNDD